MLLVISIAMQRLFVVHDSFTITHEFSVSTASNGVGQLQDSYKTPLGLHMVAEKYGHEAIANTVFVARRSTGEIYSSKLANMYPNRDWILTRIMRLSGLEFGFNSGDGIDSYDRYIYLHATPNAITTVPSSHGCIRMSNKDIITLFALCPAGTLVYITETEFTAEQCDIIEKKVLAICSKNMRY